MSSSNSGWRGTLALRAQTAFAIEPATAPPRAKVPHCGGREDNICELQRRIPV
jgi:hypothetical protein